MTHFVEVSKPLNGAAYQVLYGLTNPAACITREHKALISARFDRILVWAKTQQPDVFDAYEWAAKLILGEIEKHIQQTELNRKISAASFILPRPPKE